jgi:hypothetical protein
LPAFIVKDACMSVTGLTRTSYVGNGWYGTTVQETQGTETRNFLTAASANFYTLPFYSSSKTNCCLAPVPTISGNTIVPPNSEINYNVPIGNNGTTYNWNITNGTIQSGQGTNAISVIWNASGAAKVALNQSINNCGETAELPVSISSPLSINMSAVDLDCNGNEPSISWTVFEQNDIEAYQLEGSKETKKWENLSFVKNLNEPNTNYKIIIENSNKYKYFRLAVKNKNSKIEKYSKIISNSCYNEKSDFNIYPSPFIDKILIKNIKNIGISKIQLFDVSGKKMIQKEIDINNKSDEELQLPELVSGIYFLKIFYKNGTLFFIEKVIK